ncbi:hypothetical protein MF672_028205 [Actinomadura sp. ATCC 31491]|uniref:Uncharacterized protein n=1 Tax=Actinomadura luzonensis TaxID=2805427 RepID=A0ABT0FZ65_9ACTN|nr:hypothetical protein [Actinomadura luzonensis]MCK2217646.1 hypothetical protein [Actinomadura luzonensis]
MLADEMRRSQPHEVRAARPGPAQEEPGPARAVHRLRRIRQVSARAVTEFVTGADAGADAGIDAGIDARAS